jgi:hypothetical protein
VKEYRSVVVMPQLQFLIIINVGWFVVQHLLLLKDFGPCVMIFINVHVIIMVTVVWISFVAKGFLAL